MLPSLSVCDILPHIDSFPEPTPAEAVDRAIAIAGFLDGCLTAFVSEVVLPVRSNQVAAVLMSH